MRQVIYVVTSGSLWAVKCDHCNGSGTYQTQEQAKAAARAHVAGLPVGTLSEIRVQGRDSKFITEWTYGKDPFPPRG